MGKGYVTWQAAITCNPGAPGFVCLFERNYVDAKVKPSNGRLQRVKRPLLNVLYDWDGSSATLSSSPRLAKASGSSCSNSHWRSRF